MSPSFWKNRRITITGGAGQIGARLTEILVRSGSRVRVVDNLERGKEEHLAPVRSEIEFFKEDLRSAAVCSAACKGAEVVFHLASKVGGIGYYVQKPSEVILANTLMDTLIWQAVLDCKVPRYFYASSAHVYPAGLQTHPDAQEIRESQSAPASPELSYGWAKLLKEKQIEYYFQQARNTQTPPTTRVAVARLIGIYGGHQDVAYETGSVIPVLCRRAIEFPISPYKIWGTGQETRSFCYIDDAIHGIMKSVEKLDDHELLGPFNLGSEGRVTIQEIAETIIKISGKQIQLERDPSKKTVVWGQAFNCEMAKTLLDGWTSTTSLEDGMQRLYRRVHEQLLAKVSA